MDFLFFLKIETEGFHTIKIIFKKNYMIADIYLTIAKIYIKLIYQISMVPKLSLANQCLKVAFHYKK